MTTIKENHNHAKKSKFMNIGIIGYGAIGQALYQSITTGEGDTLHCPAVLVRRARGVGSVPLCTDPDDFLAQPLDAVVECAGHQAVRDLAARVLTQADLLVTSVGALTDDGLRDNLRTTAKTAAHKLIIPSAGIGALDMLSAAAVGGLEQVSISVRKNIEAWYGTPAEQQVDLANLKQATTVYEGPVRAGAALYPGNVNISAAVALAGIGLDRTQLRIIADPTIHSHIIDVEAQGAFGRFHFMEDVLPSTDNPKTGRIVAMALRKTLHHLASEWVIGA